MLKSCFWGAILLVLLLGACTTPFRSDVTRFHSAVPPAGKTFIIVAKNPSRADSLELKSYGAVASKFLVAQGYVPAAAGTPDLIVGIDFGVSGPVEKRNPSPAYPLWGSMYYYGGRYWYPHPWYDPYDQIYYNHPYYHWRYASYLHDPYERSYIVYERVFEMAIQENGGDVVFEGRATSIGRSKDLPAIMPYLIEALFTNFPGEDGSTVRVKIDPKDGAD